jgi:hypothetical protein
MHLRHHVLAVDDDRLPPWRAQCHMEYGAVLGDVELIATKHRIDAVAQTAFFGECDEQPERFVGDTVLRIIKIYSDLVHRKALAAMRIGGEELPQMNVLDLLVMPLKRLPRRALRERR